MHVQTLLVRQYVPQVHVQWIMKQESQKLMLTNVSVVKNVQWLVLLRQSICITKQAKLSNATFAKAVKKDLFVLTGARRGDYL